MDQPNVQRVRRDPARSLAPPRLPWIYFIKQNRHAAAMEAAVVIEKRNHKKHKTHSAFCASCGFFFNLIGG
jgi:hypothetical protein